MRIGLEFAKTGGAKYISHLDLQRAFSRAIRRSKLPVQLSQGFNPHYVVSFASALALGTESECECVEMVTTKDVIPHDFMSEINKVLPLGLCVKRAVQLKGNAPKLMAAMREAEYKVFFEDDCLDKINTTVRDIIDSEVVLAKKMSKGVEKEIDIRSMILMLDLNEECLRMRLVAAPSGSLKPDVVVNELKKRAGSFRYRIVRTTLFTHIDDLATDLLTACKE